MFLPCATDAQEDWRPTTIRCGIVNVHVCVVQRHAPVLQQIEGDRGDFRSVRGRMSILLFGLGQRHAVLL